MPDRQRFAAGPSIRPFPPPPAARRGFFAGALLFLAAAAAAQSPVPERPKIDPAVLGRAADLVYSRDLTHARTAKALNVDPALLSRTRRAVEPLVSYAPDVLPAAAHWSWIVSVETRPDAIAFCLPAGQILVTSALFDRVKLTDAEFAAVIAHVIAHALIGRDANDAVAAYQRTRGTATPDPDVNRAAVQLAEALASLMASDHYDAAAEKAADTVALELMARSGIDPGVAAGAWRKVAAAGGSSAQGLAALHPAGNERIAAIEAQVPGMMPLYQKALAARPPPDSGQPMPRR